MTTNTSKAKGMKLTIGRLDGEIFGVKSDGVYWSDGGRIDERMALASDGKSLSNMRAQSIDAKRGTKYVLVAPFGIKRQSIVALVAGLEIGESVTVEI